jgi:hypothetical protein
MTKETEDYRIVYDRATCGFIYGEPQVTMLSSLSFETWPRWGSEVATCHPIHHREAWRSTHLTKKMHSRDIVIRQLVSFYSLAALHQRVPGKIN